MKRYRYSIKKRLKNDWAEICLKTGLCDAAIGLRRWLSGSPPLAILTYHRILPSEKIGSVFSSPFIITSEKDFETQIRFIARHYCVLTFETMAKLKRKPASMRRKYAIITFDDGWQDNYHYAFPILRKYKVPATIFLATDFIGGHQVFWPERFRFLMRFLCRHGLPEAASLPETLLPWAGDLEKAKKADNPLKAAESIIRRLKNQDEKMGKSLVETLNKALGHPQFPVKSHSFLTWAQVREMSNHGISFGSHTSSHQLLSQIPESEVKYEMTSSKDRIETEIGHKITAFAYPNGMYRPEIFGQLEAAGYQVAVTTEPGLNTCRTHPYRLRRFNISSRRFLGRNGRFSGNLFAGRLAGVV